MNRRKNPTDRKTGQLADNQIYRAVSVLLAGSGPRLRDLGLTSAVLTTVAIAGIGPAHAISIGEAAVESRLGQPFSARIPVELGPDESLAAACVSLIDGPGAELARLPQASLLVPDVTGPGSHAIRVTTGAALYEPMYELQIQVRCAGTPLVVRQYVLMLDLPAAQVMPQREAPLALPASTAVTAPATAATSVAATQTERPLARTTKPAPALARGEVYRVRAGDTLLGIAARVAGADQKAWALVEAIAAANPDALIGGDINKIKLGSEITIPVAGMAPPNIAEPARTEPAAAVSTPTTEAAADTAAASAEVATALPEADVIEPGATTAELLPQATADEAAVFVDENPAPAIAIEPEPTVVQTEPTQTSSDEAPQWLATLLGLLIGAAVSVVLLRDRLLGRLRGRGTASAGSSAAAASAPGVVAPLAERTVSERVRRHDSTMVVVEELREDTVETPRMTTAAGGAIVAARTSEAYAPSGLDSDLSRLFGDEPDAQETGTDTDDPPTDELDLDLSAAAAEATVDQEFSWMSDETALTPTQQVGAVAAADGETVEQLDLQTLAQHADSGNRNVSATLEEALNLLESDYEDQFTASQVLDRKRVERLLNEDSEETLIRTGTDQFPRR